MGDRLLRSGVERQGEIVVELADRVVLLRDRRVLADGPTPGVLTADRLSRVRGVQIRIAEV